MPIQETTESPRRPTKEQVSCSLSQDDLRHIEQQAEEMQVSKSALLRQGGKNLAARSCTETRGDPMRKALPPFAKIGSGSSHKKG